MPDFVGDFRRKTEEALKLAEAGEVARLEANAGSRTRELLHPVRVEALYELAYLRVFVGWEAFLEEVFLRFLCGYTSPRGNPVPVAGFTFLRTLVQAQQAVLGGNRFVLWHNPQRVITRAQRFFATSSIEAIVLSNLARLEALAAVRHRITHAQDDARSKFDLATMSLSGRRYAGSRPGLFLRDQDPAAVPPSRWLTSLANELNNLARQVA
jgi:hypothetical protein